MDKKRARAGVLLLVLVCYALIMSALYLVFPTSRAVCVLCPMTVLAQFLENWFSPAPVVLTLCALPIAGWIAVRCSWRAGMALMRVTYTALLIVSFTITAMHVIIDLGALRSLKALGYTLVYCAVCLAHSTVCLILLGKWQPNTRFDH